MTQTWSNRVLLLFSPHQVKTFISDLLAKSPLVSTSGLCRLSNCNALLFTLFVHQRSVINWTAEERVDCDWFIYRLVLVQSAMIHSLVTGPLLHKVSHGSRAEETQDGVNKLLDVYCSVWSGSFSPQRRNQVQKRKRPFFYERVM